MPSVLDVRETKCTGSVPSISNKDDVATKLATGPEVLLTYITEFLFIILAACIKENVHVA